MSKLYLKDLERIKNGKLVKFNFGYDSNIKEEISLAKLDDQIKDLRYIRCFILNTFKSDAYELLNNTNGIIQEDNIDFDPRMLFLSKYLFITIPTVLGDTACLLSKNGLENASFESEELVKKIKILEPLIKGILNLKEKSNILDNAFYEDKKICNREYEKNLVVNGDGIVLPFREYFDLNSEEKQDLLRYYYTNSNQILEKIKVPDDDILNVYRTNVSKQKALAIYKNIE